MVGGDSKSERVPVEGAVPAPPVALSWMLVLAIIIMLGLIGAYVFIMG